MEYDDFFSDGCPKRPKVADRKKTAADFVKQLTDEGAVLSPAVAHGKAIAGKLWGREWCLALNEWQDYESRLPAGRSLLKNGAVIDLQITPNIVNALVVDNLLYHVRVTFTAPDESDLADLKSQIAGKVNSLIDLIQGNLSEEVIQIVCQQKYGLFPQHAEFKTNCDCLDDSVLCKHAVAVLYGIAARLDDDPSLFFTLRGIRPETFFNAAETLKSTAQKTSDETISTDELSETFGIDIG